MIRIASRGSELALWQARAVQRALSGADPTLPVEIRVVRTTGDRVLDVPLARIGDRGLFTKEIDDALLRGEADLAVHSLKDVPTRLAEGLRIAAVSAREDPRDVLLLPDGRCGSLDELPAGARVGTSALRRRAQLRARRPELNVADVRGNLGTRVARLDSGEYDALILAAAGVRRLGWRHRISESFPIHEWLPAVGQGALAIVTRADDEANAHRLQVVHHAATGWATTAERSFLHALEGGCQVPIAAHARIDGESLRLEGLVADLDGREVLRDAVIGGRDGAERVGAELARRLLDRGAGEILRSVRVAAGAHPPPPP